MYKIDRQVQIIVTGSHYLYNKVITISILYLCDNTVTRTTIIIIIIIFPSRTPFLYTKNH